MPCQSQLFLFAPHVNKPSSCPVLKVHVKSLSHVVYLMYVINVMYNDCIVRCPDICTTVYFFTNLKRSRVIDVYIHNGWVCSIHM